MNNNFRSSSSSANRGSYKPFGSSSPSSSMSSMSSMSSTTPRPSSSYSSSTSGSSYRSPSTSTPRPGSTPFGSSRPASSFTPLSSPSSSASSRSGYGLMNSSFSSRPSSMNRPVSVYGRSTGFYFPRDNRRTTTTFRQNDSISFNQGASILTAPAQAAAAEQYYDNQAYDQSYDQTYADQSYAEPAYEEQAYDQTYAEEPAYEETYTETTYEEAPADEGVAAEGGSPYEILNASIQNQAASSNTEIPRGVVLGDANGSVYAEAFNYIDETGYEFDGEQYILADYAGGGAAGLSIYSNAAPNAEETLDLIIDSGASELIIICEDEKEVKRIKKDKAFKKADKTLSKSGIVVDAVPLY